MGLLDPKLDKARTFELLRKRGATKAVLTFDGGHDEGSVQSIELTLVNGDVIEFETWYCGGYTLEKLPNGEYGGWVPMNKPANEDEELADLLEGPINYEFGSWGDVPYTTGTLTWDVVKEEATLNYTQDRPREYNERVSF